MSRIVLNTRVVDTHRLVNRPIIQAVFDSLPLDGVAWPETGRFDAFLLCKCGDVVGLFE